MTAYGQIVVVRFRVMCGCMRSKSFQIAIVYLSLVVTSADYLLAQTQLPTDETNISQGQASRSVARKFDEVEYARPYSECDITARLDNFVVAGLESEPNSRGYVIFYQSRRRPVRDTHIGARNYLELRGIPRNRIEAIYGGYRDNATMELWLVPQGADIPRPTPTYRRRNRRD